MLKCEMRREVIGNEVWVASRQRRTHWTYLEENHNSFLKTNKGNVLFNGTLNTFYLQLYDIRHMVEEPLP